MFSLSKLSCLGPADGRLQAANLGVSCLPFTDDLVPPVVVDILGHGEPVVLLPQAVPQDDVGVLNAEGVIVILQRQRTKTGVDSGRGRIVRRPRMTKDGQSWSLYA